MGLVIARLRFLRRLELMPTLSGSTPTKALIASWNVNGCNETGFAFGMTSHLIAIDIDHLYQQVVGLALSLR
ncbi:MAG: hypothetical protein Q7S58_10045 [Candidatus Binatus sp.]|uniref:hypothetical protein n=1 Tax=Candidatus Binatus sp. TaxID=2811406 RepID=UPI002718CFD5|nr:hypothetical protein [Candidatus Binatus sp.]MDO8432734.1 hypothetical protein [Candidatus Binatus sp.]